MELIFWCFKKKIIIIIDKLKFQLKHQIPIKLIIFIKIYLLH
jgi:hypothetical protein